MNISKRKAIRYFNKIVNKKKTNNLFVKNTKKSLFVSILIKISQICLILINTCIIPNILLTFCT